MRVTSEHVVCVCVETAGYVNRLDPKQKSLEEGV